MPQQTPNEILAAEYVEQLTTQQKKVLVIAKEHLGSSFNIIKSIGFKQWVAKRN